MSSRVILSDDDSSDSEPEVPQPRKTSSRTSKPSEKQAQNNQKAKEAEAKRWADIEKKMKKLERENAKLQDRIHEHDANHVPPEEEDTEDIPMSRHQRSIVSKGVFSSSPPRPAKKRSRRKDVDKPVVRVMPQKKRAPLGTQDTNIDGAEDDDHQSTIDIDPDESASSHHDDEQPADDEDLAGADDDEEPDVRGKRPRASMRSSSPAPSRPKKKSKTTTSNTALEKVRFVAGHPPSGTRTNLSDLVPEHRRRVSSVQERFEILIATRLGYPPPEVAALWAIECWDEDDNGLELTDRISGMITKYGVHARSAIVAIVRPIVVRHYKLKGGVEAVIARVAELLTNDAFAHQDPGTLDLYAENEVIKEVIQDVWFSKSTSRGVKFAKFFNPISLPTLAMVLTVIEFCIKLYEKGERPEGRVVFDETYHKTRYEAHLKSLTDWDSLIPEETLAYRQRLHDECRKACTGSAVVPTDGGLSAAARARALAQLEARRAARE